MSRRPGPILIEEEAAEARPDASPLDAPPVPDADRVPSGEAMRTLSSLAARRSSALGRWFRRSLAALVAFLVSTAAWAWIGALVARNPVLGWTAMILMAAVALTLLGLVARELRALARLKQVGDVQLAAAAALRAEEMAPARAVIDRVVALYAGRREVDWGRRRLIERRDEVFDPDALFALAEAELLRPLDIAARAEVEAAARQVAAVTAVVPLAFADVFAALGSNVRMIRRIAEIYGGRAGTLGAWRLTRAVFTHLVATGAVAVGDDLVGSVAGGSILTRVSRRFGEGIVNGALTARVGVAAIEVCRPLPFVGERAPQVHRIVGSAMSSLFPKSRDEA